MKFIICPAAHVETSEKYPLISWQPGSWQISERSIMHVISWQVAAWLVAACSAGIESVSIHPAGRQTHASGGDTPLSQPTLFQRKMLFLRK